MPKVKPLKGKNGTATVASIGKIKPALCQAANTLPMNALLPKSARTGGATMNNTILDWVMIAVFGALVSVVIYCSVTGCGTDNHEDYYE